jgi:hypothetical protein
MHYRMNLPRIAHETLDNETIIIDFDRGTYYSLQDTSHWIWHLLEKMLSVEEIIDQTTTCFTGEQEEMEAAVRQFVGKLAQAELIVKTTAPLAKTSPLLAVHQGPFTPPLLEEHSDIQDLLLLDPIHEVSKQGWPMRNA